MLSLEHETRMLSQAVLADHPATIGGALSLTARPGADAHARLGIYRNNTFASLTAALLAVYPVTARLVDERFFRYVAHQFITAHPPAEPRLSQFGAMLPRFLAENGPLRDMRYVAETARLEWAIARALDLSWRAPMNIADMAAQATPGAVALDLQPSLQLFASRWPAYSIWTAHQQAGDPALDFVRRGNAERVAVWRRGASIRMLRLDAAPFAFLRGLARHDTLDQAVTRALRTDPFFDLATALAQLFREGVVTGLSQP